MDGISEPVGSEIHTPLQLMGMFLLNSVEIQLKPMLDAIVYPAQELSWLWKGEVLAKSFSEMFCKANLS